MRDQDELLKLYLLGDLEEEEESRLEARLIQEDELFESLEAAEADLLDEYAHGGLSPEERGQLERRLLSSPQGRRRLAVIRGLGEIAAQETNVVQGPWGGKKLSLPQMRALAAAAMLVIAIGSVWIARQTVPIPDANEQVVELPTPTPVPVAPIPVPPPPQPVDDRIAGQQPTPPPAPPALAPYVLQLAFAATRSGVQIEEHVIPPDKERVELRLAPEEELEEHRPYTVKLVDTTTLSTVHEKELQPRKIGGEPLLVLELDADLLKEHMSVEIYEDGAQAPFVTKEFDFRRQDG